MSPLLWVVTAVAPGLTPQLESAVPTGCPDATVIQAQFSALLIEPPAEGLGLFMAYVPGQSQLKVSARVTRDGTQLFERRLQGAPADCETLMSSLVLSVALALDDMQTPKAPPPLRWQLHMGLLGSTGPLPSIGLTTEVGGRVRGADWGAGLSLRLEASGSGEVAIGDVDGVLYASASTVCRYAGGWALCGVGMLGVQTLSGAAFAQNNDVTSLYAAGGVRIAHGWDWGAWQVAIVGEGWRPFTRLHLTVSGDRAWQTPAWVGTLGVDVTHQF